MTRNRYIRALLEDQQTHFVPKLPKEFPPSRRTLFNLYKALSFTAHKPDCVSSTEIGGPVRYCKCGLSDLLTQIGYNLEYGEDQPDPYDPNFRDFFDFPE